jgi:hypothetical protein
VHPGLDLTAADASAIGPLEKDLQLIGLLGGQPCEFDSPVELGTKRTAVSRPRELATYGRYVAQLAAHYRGDIRLWQSWHAPNRASCWGEAPDAAIYAGMLELQYEALKNVDPDARLALGPIAGCDLVFLAAVLEALNGRRAFDLIATLPYRWDGPRTADTVDIVTEDGRTVIPMDWKHELLALHSLTASMSQPDELMIAEFDWSQRGQVELHAHGMLGSHAESHAEENERQTAHIDEATTLLRDDPEMDFVQTALMFDLETAEPEPLAREVELTREFEGNVAQDHAGDRSGVVSG